MRFKNIIHTIGIMLVVGFFHTSCVEESDKNGKGQPAPEGEAYFSLKVKTGDAEAFTRSGNELGSAAELAVHSVRVVLYDGNESEAQKCKVEYVFEYNLETPSAWNNTGNPAGWITDSGGGTGNVDQGDPYIIPSGDHLSPEARAGYEFATFAQRIKDKPYKMLVILNGQDENKTFNTAVYKATNKGNYLSTFTAAVSASIDPLTGELADGKGILMTNHQGLVEVSKSDLTKTADEAHKAPISVSVDRMVAKVTVKHADNFQWPAGIDKTSVTWGVDITNKFTYRMREQVPGESYDATMSTLYAVDPNYEILLTDKLKTTHFNSLFVNDDGYSHLPAANVNHSLGDYVYIPENTINSQGMNIANFSDQVTRIIIGYKYKPSGYNGTENYYIYQNVVLSQEEINKYLTVPNFSIPGVTNLDVALTNIQSEGKYPLTGTGDDYFETYGLRYCPKGQLYFMIPIQHFGGSEGTPGCYGVVRNNIYEITVNKLSPPDLAGPYLSAYIHIQPWAQRSQANVIGTEVSEFRWQPVKVYHWYQRDYTNLYQKWIAKKVPGCKDAYETVMWREGRSITSKIINDEIHKENEFKADLPGYLGLMFTYTQQTLPFIVSDNPDMNVLDLYYTQGFLFSGLGGFVQLCFIKEDGTILNVVGEDFNASNILDTYTDNPRRYFLSYTYRESEPTKGYVYFKHVILKNKITITDSDDNEYVITSAADCARFYEIRQTTATHVKWGKFETVPKSEEPAFVADRLSNGTFSGDGEKGVGIICVPK